MNLNQVTIPVSDVEKSIAFYQTLGLKLIVKALPRYARFECPDGNATFSLHHVDHEINSNGTSIYFECDDLDEKVENLKNQGIKFDEDPEDRSWLWREARLRDPDGNNLILYYAGKNRLNPPWRIEG